mmetsp:Transcript_6393/g.20746  ORF Transcript_6393/g.20746 Transcript_6393/m.20746 type:complete len:208 (+) Transcript_6393:789-1412(+)
MTTRQAVGCSFPPASSSGSSARYRRKWPRWLMAKLESRPCPYPWAVSSKRRKTPAFSTRTCTRSTMEAMVRAAPATEAGDAKSHGMCTVRRRPACPSVVAAAGAVFVDLDRCNSSTGRLPIRPSLPAPFSLSAALCKACTAAPPMPLDPPVNTITNGPSPGRKRGEECRANGPMYIEATSSLVEEGERGRLDTNLSITGVRGGGGIE